MHDVKMPASPILSISASFSSYCCEELGKAADRIVEEFRAESNLDLDHDLSIFYDQNAHKENGFHEESKDQLKKAANGVENSSENKLKCEEKGEIEEDEDFEFPSIVRNSVSSPALADEIFCNGQIRPMYSVSWNNLQVVEDGVTKFRKEATPPRQQPVRQPLRLLFLEDTDSSSSCSSSEVDDLYGLPPESYCIVEPKTEAAAAKEEVQCRKSKSKGSLKRWRLRNFINRSSSEGGKGRSVFPSPDEAHHHGKRKDQKLEKSKGTGKSHGGGGGGGAVCEIRRR